jgi:hypothetical protein
MKACTQCGKEHFLSYKRCEDCREKLRKERNGRYRQNRLNPKLVFSAYRNGARIRNIEFSLTYKIFLRLWQYPCFYCGSEIENIGLDRVDNSQGYTKDNIVPCCTTCNFMKRTMGVDEFISHCRKIAYYQP